MRCIFCKQDSSTSKAIEHIIPESLGNIEHTLPAGVVCDKCNNYFGLKVEKPLLDSAYFREARSRNLVHNKEHRIPTVQGFVLPGMIPIDMMEDSFFTSKERDIPRLVEILQKYKKGSIIVPILEQPDDYLMSRFLARTAIEVLASRVLVNPSGLDEIIDHRDLDSLREYARFGRNTKPKPWRFNMRAIYPEGKLFRENNQRFEVLHEYNLLYTEYCEIYLIIVIFGIEYAINMGEPEIDGYIDWLKTHDYKSPLYMDNPSLLE
jgi:hypothetical protein